MRLFIVRWIGGWETNATAMVSHPPEPPVILWFLGSCVSVRILPSFPPASVGADAPTLCAAGAARRYQTNGARYECAPIVHRKRAPIPAAPGARGARLRFARRGYFVRPQTAPARLWRARAGCGVALRSSAAPFRARVRALQGEGARLK